VVRAVRLAVVLPIALASVVATSMSEYTVTYAVGAVPGLDGDGAMLVARFDDSYGRRYEIVLVSRDGRSWHQADSPAATSIPSPATDAPSRSARTRVTRTASEPTCAIDGGPCPIHLAPDDVEAVEAAVEAAQVPRPVDCAPGRTRCWRTVPGHLAIEESTNGGATWTTAWSVSESTRDRYVSVVADDASELDDYPVDDLDQEMTCTNVYVVPRSGVVVVACGLMGFVSRDTAGEWTILGFDGEGLAAQFLDESASPGNGD
jgi:hypothetical protein